jgi:imidazole glycerol-phosphate synthase subunit HisF
LPADTIDEVKTVAKEMEKMGVDFIGLMTGMSYEGIEAGEIPQLIKERLNALVETVHVPTLAEGGINAENYKAFSKTGVNILVVGTAFDDMAKNAIKEAVKQARRQASSKSGQILGVLGLHGKTLHNFYSCLPSSLKIWL